MKMFSFRLSFEIYRSKNWYATFSCGHRSIRVYNIARNWYLEDTQAICERCRADRYIHYWTYR
jgi:hypothetical protein